MLVIIDGTVIMGGGKQSRDREFESHHFSHLFFAKSYCF